MKTVVQKLLDDLAEIEKRGVEISNTGFMMVLESLLSKERDQITEAFDEGVKYGNSLIQTFDYPASRYYEFTYKEDENT